MRKILFAALLAALAVAVVPAATATTSSTVTVSITNVAFVPKSVSINVGDSVKWTNTSTVNQQVSCAKCPFASPALKAGDSYTYTFKTKGKFAITDPLDSTIKGSVTVAAAPNASVTLAATPVAVRYGRPTLLSGKISSAKSGQNVTILGKESGQTVFTHLATAKTGTGGKYSVTRTPSMNTTYEAMWTTATSAAVAVHVQPRIALAKVASHRFRVQVKAAKSFVGKTVIFQRRTALGTWVRVKRVTLKTAVTIGTTTITKATFRSKIRRGKRVRILLKAGQAAPAYIGGHSNVIRS